MREEKTVYYDKNDMLALKEMSNEEAAEWLDRLDRGYFNIFHYPDSDPEYKEYSEWEYREFAMQVALARANNLLRTTKEV